MTAGRPHAPGPRVTRSTATAQSIISLTNRHPQTHILTVSSTVGKIHVPSLKYSTHTLNADDWISLQISACSYILPGNIPMINALYRSERVTESSSVFLSSPCRTHSLRALHTVSPTQRQVAEGSASQRVYLPSSVPSTGDTRGGLDQTSP